MAVERSNPPLWPLYVGGFLGPFGGAMVAPMLKELGSGLHASLVTMGWAVTSYMVPFAALMLVSGTLGERWGRARVVRIAYWLYAAASLACVLAPSLVPFLAGRALQGAANAFTTPLLLATISDLVPRSQLGASLGRYGSMQAAGTAFSPLVGGAAAGLDYRLAFGAVALVAAMLAMITPAADHLDDAGVRPPFRAVLNPRLFAVCGVGAGLYFSSTGMNVVVAVHAGEHFGLNPTGRGLVVAAFGVAGLLTGAYTGRTADRFGQRRAGMVFLAVFALAVAATAYSPTVAVLAAFVGLAGAASTGGRVITTSLAMLSTPENRGGATSFMLSWQFLGSALGPIVLLPLYIQDPQQALVTAAAGGVFAMAALVVSAAIAHPYRFTRPTGPAAP